MRVKALDLSLECAEKGGLTGIAVISPPTVGLNVAPAWLSRFPQSLWIIEECYGLPKTVLRNHKR